MKYFSTIFLISSKFRGESEEDDPWTFDSEYDYYYGGGDIPYYWSETVPPL